MNRSLGRWLRAGGSLSRRLAALGRFEVQAVREGAGRLLPGELRDLSFRRGRCWVREVVLRVDGVPLVWARSVTPCRGVSGPWRALRRLGTRPLAALLFGDVRVRRSGLRVESHRRGGPWHRRASSCWGAVSSTPCWPSSRLCGRSSVFRHREAPLRVFEAFVPAMAHRRVRGPCPMRAGR